MRSARGSGAETRCAAPALAAALLLLPAPGGRADRKAAQPPRSEAQPSEVREGQPAQPPRSEAQPSEGRPRTGEAREPKPGDAPPAGASPSPLPREMRLALRGEVRFTVPVNLRFLTIHGWTRALTGSVGVAPDEGGFALRDAALRVPVASLSTGMGLRDRHMRERIFATEDGGLPDVVFDSEAGRCRLAGETALCRVEGRLAIRARERPFAVDLRVTRSDGGFHAEGEGRVRLSDYEIERPSQFGVKTADEVLLEIEVRGRPAPGDADAGGDR
jgi:polyisoprenoid-binding protein YceI